MAYAMIDWSEERAVFLVRPSKGVATWCWSANEAIVDARAHDKQMRVNERMPAEKLIEVMAAAIFARVPLRNMAGKEITETPVPDAKVAYITRQQLGAIIPDGWFVEVQLNRYSACFGETLSLPSRVTLAAAISDMHEFLALSIKQATDDLLESVRAQRASAEMEQVPMWLSSDRRGAAADASAELDDITHT